MIIAAQYAGLAVVSAFIYWLVVLAMKCRILPFVWLTFSGGGVIAAMFLPILVLLLAFALPLGWVIRATRTSRASSTTGSPGSCCSA